MGGRIDELLARLEQDPQDGEAAKGAYELIAEVGPANADAASALARIRRMRRE
jgi:hypothetical protein